MTGTVVLDEVVHGPKSLTSSIPKTRLKPSLGHLRKATLRELCDAASFLVQEYGVALNARIVLAHGLLGSNVPSEAAVLVSDLVHELGMTLKRWSPGQCGQFHWLYSHARGNSTGLTTMVVAHIPVRFAADAEEWLFDRFLARRVGWPLPAAAVRMRVTHHTEPSSLMVRHNQLVRLLCRGADPDIVVRVNGDRQRLIDVLRIPRRIRERMSGAGVAQIARVSRTLGKKAQVACAADRLAFLSAFDDEAWNFLMAGWELVEHQNRQREKAERAKALATLRVQWPEGLGLRQDQLRSEALRTLVASWPIDPKKRLRTWRGWWLADVPDFVSQSG